MNTLNRREMLQLGAACSLSALVGEAGFSSAAAAPSAKSATGQPPIKTRMFWTWDHSTEWALNRPGAHSVGSCNEYGRTKEAFVEDYSALLRWCGRHNIDAVVVWDLDRLDILNDVTVIAWGEFGRTPRINKDGGRDHWPQVCSAILAGGGLKTGQVIGSTNRLGENAKDRPVTFGEVFATLYQAIGLNPELNPVNDPTGRPQHLAEGPVMKELI